MNTNSDIAEAVAEGHQRFASRVVRRWLTLNLIVFVVVPLLLMSLAAVVCVLGGFGLIVASNISLVTPTP